MTVMTTEKVRKPNPRNEIVDMKMNGNLWNGLKMTISYPLKNRIFNLLKYKINMSRKCNVVVNGRLMTVETRKQAVLESLMRLGNNWSTTDTILSMAVSNGLMERKNDKRIKANSHPIWKIMSLMTEEPIGKKTAPLEYRCNSKGLLEYRIRNPKHVYLNGERMGIKFTND